jgi:hypothetical protein
MWHAIYSDSFCTMITANHMLHRNLHDAWVTHLAYAIKRPRISLVACVDSFRDKNTAGWLCCPARFGSFVAGSSEFSVFSGLVPGLLESCLLHCRVCTYLCPEAGQGPQRLPTIRSCVRAPWFVRSSCLASDDRARVSSDGWIRSRRLRWMDGYGKLAKVLVLTYRSGHRCERNAEYA